MKNKFTLLVITLSLVLMIFSTKIFAKEVEIQLVMGKEIVTRKVDSEISEWVIFSGAHNPNIVCDIKGLNQLTNLTSLEIPILNYKGDFRFLKDCKNLKVLFLNGGTITSFKFLEELENLEYLELNMYINKDDVGKIYSQEIDFANLNNIKDIRFSPIVESSNKTSKYDRIPNFVNVQNKPKIFLENNVIKTLTERDIELLNQYSEVNIYTNTILENSIEIEKIKNLNLNYM